MEISFRDCRIDLLSRQLWRGNEEVHVEPQVFDLIVLLTRHPKEVLSRDTLIAEIWNGVIVSDATISARISAARAALGDSGQRQEVIRTVPRRGIMFVADLAGGPATPPARRDKGPPAVHYASSADGSAIAWSVSGAGRPLVRIGHWLSHLELDWKGPIWGELIDRLGAENRVIRFDLRGTGLSARDAPLTGIDDFVADLLAVIDAAGEDRVSLYAPSQAGPVAIAFAARYPEKVDRIAILGGYTEGRIHRAARTDTVTEETMLDMIRAGWGRRESAFMSAFSTLFVPDATPEQRDALVEMQLATADPETAVTLRQAIDRFLVTDLLEKVQAPTLVFHAENDAIHPMSQGQKIAAGIAGAEFIRLPGRNHVLLPQEPGFAQMMDRLNPFLRS
ncbi:alpha/beta hydrolase [Ponticoccus sp. SC2-23]|uniref:alpha/beta fold hydrolase n=1 Tax=Alexandriicola marinus TaxID=2081710 RepID=UPI0013E01CE8|nr:alpha/beta fold hydrolase [Alexandriicola marinus]MBM1218808.1 alpha/beta hydrolase [Ponticoccus sp. SC6-9]MBM1224120.1 alpha/beta hydrolase [Ponticoccus sp. SC6-15]MBM1230101.1 alpha/beta hydrolase [Ponticoccus sp. SC6-38]MBM1233086.1 alpha/beta hydrolase [Ponticoccus sp. SC6-45]MBM1236964.1 alpha/beta hydrolase [Ponticoccus sp. SC6-49]MBM1242097.1 alpha/beta hydrolase [Ponticoccus sp. SC2-64]MBM1251088.1 alpha/beta hydrolase [Ponticoccus sp. SC6-33]MBM1259479.1 alpha/beta hydrolase [Po